MSDRIEELQLARGMWERKAHELQEQLDAARASLSRAADTERQLAERLARVEAALERSHYVEEHSGDADIRGSYACPVLTMQRENSLLWGVAERFGPLLCDVADFLGSVRVKEDEAGTLAAQVAVVVRKMRTAASLWAATAALRSAPSLARAVAIEAIRRNMVKA